MKKNEKEWSQQMQNKNTKTFSSFVTFIRYAMILSFLKLTLFDSRAVVLLLHILCYAPWVMGFEAVHGFAV